MDKPSIDFLGLGAMGAHMARNALAGRIGVTVFNRPRQRAEVLSSGGAIGTDPFR